jgi:hypothetical protein
MMGIATVGFVISAVTLNLPARYLSCFLFASGTSTVNQCIWDFPTDTMSRRLLGQLCHPRLGLGYPRPNAREESRLTVHRQCCIDGQFHLHALLVPKIRWAKVCHRDEQ